MGCERWMTDIEGVGKMPGGVILSIGWVRFSRQGVQYDTAREIRLDIQSQLDIGQTVDGDTINWWLTQTALPWKEGLDVTYPLPGIVTFADDLAKADEVWAKPPEYDLAGIRSLAAAVDQERLMPSFRTHRCFRTLKAMAPAPCHLPKLADGTKHGALVDAIHQAEEAVLMLNHFLAG